MIDWNYVNNEKVIELCAGTALILQEDIHTMAAEHNWKRTHTMSTLLVNANRMVEMLGQMRSSDRKLGANIEEVFDCLVSTYEVCARYDFKSSNGESLVDVWSTAKAWGHRQDAKSQPGKAPSDIANLFSND